MAAFMLRRRAAAQAHAFAAAATPASAPAPAVSAAAPRPNALSSPSALGLPALRRAYSTPSQKAHAVPASAPKERIECVLHPHCSVFPGYPSPHPG